MAGWEENLIQLSEQLMVVFPGQKQKLILLVFQHLPVYDIQFYNSKFGYASGGVIDCCGIMWWTTNGGNYWYVIDTPFVALEPIYQVHTYDSLNVLGVGGDFESTGYGVGMMRTSDGGAVWEFEYIGISWSCLGY